jgi:tetratricopeptide (TPR) repeat protein/DNA-binding XRE family transcriptional regulator
MDVLGDLFFGELLQQFRRRKRLGQKQLAKLIGVSRETISLWERGYYKPETDTMLYELGRVLGLTEQEQQQLFEAYTITALTTSFHNPPLERNPYFTGRSPQLTNLHTLLMAGKQVALTQAISGLGGIGKTHLALEYAYRYQKSYHDIFWVTADTYDSLMASFVQLAALLQLPDYGEPDQSKVKVAVQRWLSKHKGWLLILDNMENLSLVHQFVPVDRQGAVLLTTRRQVTEPVAQALELGVLPENDSILFLLKRTKILAFDRALDDALVNDIAAARIIAQELGNLPLALDQAGAYLLETGCSFTDYIDLLTKHRAELLHRRAGRGIPTDHPESVTTTFMLNFRQVQQRNESAAELLRVCALLAPDDIGEEIFTQGASELGPILQPLASDALLLNQAMEVLRAFSLIRRNPEEKTLSIHRLVQAVLKDGMDKETFRVWAERAMLAVNAAFPHTEHGVWLQYGRLLPHALLVAQYIETDLIISEEAGRLLYETATYLRDRARYIEAELLYQRALRIREQQLGPEHPDVAHTLNGLANLYAEQGKYVEAELLYQRALRIWEQHLGPEHPDVATTLNNLALLYAEQGKFVEAEPLYQRALRIWEQHLGPEHPDVAYPLNNLAILYYEQSKYMEAELLYQRALRIREQQLGPEHPEVATTLNNLALLYYEQGKYVEAEPLYQRALRIWEQQLGPEHPLVAYSLEGLANLYRDRGKYAEAEPLYQRALRIRKQMLGPEHLETAETMYGLAQLREVQGNNEEAKTLYAHVLAVREQIFGAHHPKTMETRRRLIPLLHTMGQHKEATQLEAAQAEQGMSEEERKTHPEE